MEHAEKVSVRAELLDRLKLELIGPNKDDETLEETPTQRYLTGILWPAGTQFEADDDEEIAAGQEGEESGNPEMIAPLLQAMKPSSIGLSFVVELGITSLRVSAAWGIYTKNTDNNKQWTRAALSESIDIDISTTINKRKKYPLTCDRGVCLEWIGRPLGNRAAVSLFLVNRKNAPEKGPKDSYCIFQPVITVTAPDSGVKPFSARTAEITENPYKPPDIASDELLYRNQTVFAVGHGTAAEWEDISDDNHSAGIIRSAIMPSYEIPRVIPPAWTGSGSLDMNELAEAPDSQSVFKSLHPLCEDYSRWIEKRDREVKSLPKALIPTAEKHIDECRNSLSRMMQGLELIKDNNNPDVFESFRFINRVMSLQRTRTVWSKECRKKNDWSEEPPPVKAEWRPFQIAFILQALKGIADPLDSDRGITDLLWFPTGGGKTEAYLGLAAFTMALRRLRGNTDIFRSDSGVNVLMRYTLRLLTIQQYQRAATLICACETIRKEYPGVWGNVAFRIGLWVGSKSTPNNFDECEEFLNRRQQQTGKASPVQLVNCPWCGATLKEKDYFADKRRRRVIIGCSRPACEFHRTKNPEGIPALVEDEEIYRLLPAMIIGTVDKFARMPWVGEIQSLFGQVSGEIERWGFVTGSESKETLDRIRQVTNESNLKLSDSRRILPPDLIIQDELHLISGPLGSMVGLYESSIDWLCSRKIADKTVHPKIVASTATIRRADHQVRQLFNRRLAIFPSPGLDAGDSYFAREQALREKPGRIYTGIFAPGRSVKTALVRVYSALLASTGSMTYTEEDKDPFQTLVGYFNSLRELGGAVRLIEDDVRARIKVLANRTLGQLYPYTARELGDKIPELTSRIDSSDIPEILESLERRFVNVKKDEKQPVDVILASNMISVGVDIDRLGLMVVTGQPKTSAEYIQATSRIGREYPGLVITVYNWARPRDLSHYERFRSYHASLYRYVEAISVTPFSSRARDRALAAALIAAWRLGVPGMSAQRGAGKFKSNNDEAKVIREHLVQRVNEIEGTARSGEVLADLQVLMDRWDTETHKGNLTYDRGGNRTPKLLYYLGKKPQALFPAPNSMRDVETSIGIFLKRGDY